MKKYKVVCPFCECSFEIGKTETITCMCGVCATFKNGHLKGLIGGADEHYFYVKDLLTGEERVEKEI